MHNSCQRNKFIQEAPEINRLYWLFRRHLVSQKGGLGNVCMESLYGASSARAYSIDEELQKNVKVLGATQLRRWGCDVSALCDPRPSCCDIRGPPDDPVRPQRVPSGLHISSLGMNPKGFSQAFVNST
jgi:hypothetical protein